MYQPGHLHLEHTPIQHQDVAYHLDIRYEVQQTEQGRVMRFDIKGEIAGKALAETFDLPREMACNFASSIDRIARKHGLPKTQVVPVSLHKQYDAMFEDIREKLQITAGEALSSERLGRM